MSTTECGSELELVHGKPARKGLMAFVMLRTKSVWRVFRNRLAANSLYDLDDSQLNDIGITRHDVVMALNQSGALDDPSLLLSRAARERARHRFARPANR